MTDECAALRVLWTKLWHEWCAEPWEDFQEFAEEAGLVEQVVYDPALHGDLDYEAGEDMIYVLTKVGRRALVPAAGEDQ